MDWTQTTLQPDFLNGLFRGYYRTPEALRDWAAIRESIVKCGEHFRLLDGILASQPFLTGETLSLADIAAGAGLYRYFGLDLERPPLPNVEAWYRRLQERAPYRENVMVSFDDLRAQ